MRKNKRDDYVATCQILCEGCKQQNTMYYNHSRKYWFIKEHADTMKAKCPQCFELIRRQGQ